MILMEFTKGASVWIEPSKLEETVFGQDQHAAIVVCAICLVASVIFPKLD